MTDDSQDPRTVPPGGHTPMADLRHKRLGSVLVALQFTLLAAVIVPALPMLAHAAASPVAWTLLIAGLLLGAWAMSANRPGNFNIRPTPRAGGSLVQRGPYRWIRHPMYSALLLIALGCAWMSPFALSWLALLALAAVLATKAAFEERWMLTVHPAYADYRRRTRRFVPWLM